MANRPRVLGALLLIATSGPVLAGEHLPTRVGECVTTRVKEVSFRLGDMKGGKFVASPGTGSRIVMTNGGSQVSYDQVPALDASRAGDPVRMCLKSLPQGCPPGDRRGIEYRSTDLRTNMNWTLPDSEHSCGGA